MYLVQSHQTQVHNNRLHDKMQHLTTEIVLDLQKTNAHAIEIELMVGDFFEMFVVEKMYDRQTKIDFKIHTSSIPNLIDHKGNSRDSMSH